MKVCMNCNMGYPDETMVCPRCGNQNLTYYPNQMQQKQSNFKFGAFFKEYFKSPLSAKTNAINRKDYGSALLVGGISFVVYFLYVLCLQGGIAIRYHGSISAAFTLIYPFLFFIIIFGFQFLDVFLYSLYANSRKRLINNKTALPVFIYCTTSRLVPLMILAFASLLSLASPILGAIVALIAVSASIMSSCCAKVRFGMEPASFLDSFMFALTGFLAFLLSVLFIALFLYLFVRTSISGMLSLSNMFF